MFSLPSRQPRVAVTRAGPVSVYRSFRDHSKSPSFTSSCCVSITSSGCKLVSHSFSTMLTTIKLKASLFFDLPLIREFSAIGPRFISNQNQTQTSQVPTAVATATTTPIKPVLPLAQRIPSRSWDSHIHVVEPERYPISPNALYAPCSHTLAQAQAFEASVGLQNTVLVQPSIYAFDNTCLLEALKDIGPSRGRGIVVIDPDTIQPETLVHWHALGVRGVRVNLKSVGQVMSGNELTKTLTEHADVIRSLGWVLQVYVSLDMMPALEQCMPRLGVKVCVDHYGSPDLSFVVSDGSFDPYSLPGFSSLVRLLQAGRTYVKLSAPYRVSRDPQLRDIYIVTKELLRVAQDRVVFATDWPHTRFDGLDIRPFTEMCLQLCGQDQKLAERLFRRNAEELWDVQDD